MRKLRTREVDIFDSDIKHGFDPWVRKIPWRRKWWPTTVLLPGKIPWTEESGGLQSMGLQSWTWLSDWAHNYLFSSVQLLSCVRFFATPWTAAHQASLSITNPWSPPKLMSIELVMPSNHLILCRALSLLSFPASGSFQMSQLFASHFAPLPY